MRAPTETKEINAWVKDACHIIRPNMLRKIKFVQEGDDVPVAKEFYHHKFAGKEDKPDEKLWVKTFKLLVVRAYNAVRSNIQSDLRTCVMAFAEQQNQTNSNPHIGMDLIKKCVLRDINLADDWEKKVFTFYWMELVRKYLEVGHFFGQAQKY